MINTNLTIQMGQMQELKESMNFLDRMRAIIGEEDYQNRAKNLMAFLPDPKTYTTEVTRSKELMAENKKEPWEEEDAVVELDDNNSLVSGAAVLPEAIDIIVKFPEEDE